MEYIQEQKDQFKSFFKNYNPKENGQRAVMGLVIFSMFSILMMILLAIL